MSHCTVEYSSLGVDVRVNTFSAAVNITDSIIRHTAGRGIFVRGDSGSKVSVDISGNQVADNSGYGIYCYANGGSTELAGTISGNTISSSGGYGLYVYSYSGKSTLTIESNTIHNSNQYGIYLYCRDTLTRRSEFSVKGNTVYATTNSNGAGIYCYKDDSEVGLSVTGNSVYDNAGRGIYVYGGGSYYLDSEVVGGGPV
jgi:hypothetical protein